MTTINTGLITYSINYNDLDKLMLTQADEFPFAGCFEKIYILNEDYSNSPVINQSKLVKNFGDINASLTSD